MSSCRAVLIAGPTASGKSAAALDLAEATGGMVANADSMQVYADLRVLTARPDEGEEARAPHRLYGHVPAAEPYSVGRWLADMEAVLAEAARAGRLPIVVGGTGLYFKALLEGLSPVPDIANDIRAHWRAEAARLGAGGLHAVLGVRDPEMAARLRPSDPQRLVRALEVLDATGRSLADWQAQAGRPLLAAAATARIVLMPERAALHAAIEARLDRMLGAGALAEVAALEAKGLPSHLPVMRAVGVPALRAYLRSELGLSAARECILSDTRGYAKRQATWLRRNMIAWRALNEQYTERLLPEFLRLLTVGG